MTYDTDINNVSPGGVTYDPFGTGKTSVREPGIVLRRVQARETLPERALAPPFQPLQQSLLFESTNSAVQLVSNPYTALHRARLDSGGLTFIGWSLANYSRRHSSSNTT